MYFHGGQNEHGSSTDPELEASMLATHGDVIVVTFNYRLGVFGFMHNLDVTPANSVGELALLCCRLSIGQFSFLDGGPFWTSESK